MKCANCKKPAKLACSSCKGAPVLNGDAPIVHYCKAECQKVDWTRHKPTCLRLKDRKQFYRAMSIAQKLWLIYRELTWIHTTLHSVKKVGDMMILRANDKREPKWPVDYEPFPNRFFSMESDRKAALSWDGCIDAIYWTTEFIEGLVKGIVSNTVWINFATKNNKLQIRRFEKEWDQSVIDKYLGFDQRQINGPLDMLFKYREPLHEILKVTLRSGEIFAVDVAGAQYGYSDPVTPWKEYEQNRILDRTKIPGVILLSGNITEKPAPSPRNLIYVDDFSQAKMDSFRRSGLSVRSHGQGMETFIKFMNCAILEWQAGGNLGLKILWKMPEAEFEEAQANLVDYVHWLYFGLREAMNHMGRARESPSFTVRGKELDKEIAEWVFMK